KRAQPAHHEFADIVRYLLGIDSICAPNRVEGTLPGILRVIVQRVQKVDERPEGAPQLRHGLNIARRVCHMRSVRKEEASGPCGRLRQEGKRLTWRLMRVLGRYRPLARFLAAEAGMELG